MLLGIEFHHAVQEFLRMYPKTSNNQFYLIADGFAARYIPTLLVKLIDIKKKFEGEGENPYKILVPLNLKGVILANPEFNIAINIRQILKMFDGNLNSVGF